MEGSGSGGSGKERTEKEREIYRDVVCFVWCFEMTLRRRCVLRDKWCVGNWRTE